MRSELDVQAIPGKKYLQTTEISTSLLIYCGSFKTQEMHTTELAEKSSS